MLRATPPGEDGAPGRRSGNGTAQPYPAGTFGPGSGARDDLENFALEQATGDADREDDEDEQPFDEKPSDAEFLQMVREADTQALQYVSQVNRTSWERGYRAFHQEHNDGSKYNSDDYRNRSRLFIPKTRTAIRKDLSAVAASLFGSVDAISTAPGNEGDPEQRASAAVIQELVNYRTNRQSMKASIPWFHVAMGSRQTSLLTGICLSKQYWKLELKRYGQEDFEDDEGETRQRDVWKPYIDRPESELIPPENFTIDPAADWRNPAQDAAYIVIKWPMRIDEIRRRQRDPRRPWNKLSEEVLRSAGEGQQAESDAIRRAREQGLNRFDKSQTAPHFDIIWVWETYVRTAGEDWTFFSISDKHMLTDPAPVEEVYPEQFGERPLALGYGAFEAFRIFPMSAVESWKQLQQESNDIRNLALDSLKQNIMPVTKVVRGRNVDLDQLKRRGQGTSIMVSNKDDVTWEKVQSVGSEVQAMTQKIDIEFDDLSGQQNYGTVADNNNLGKTLGGLKLAAGAANAVQEFDIRIWIETWCEPVLTQIVRLEQYYESDPIVLGICGDKAKLLEKHGISEITDRLLENTVNIRVNVGLGAGDPQQRLAKFQSAVQVATPMLQLDPDFKNGKKVIDGEAVMSEVFGAAGYRDGGKRFIKDGPPQAPNALQDAQTAETLASAELKKQQGKKAVLDALSNAAKVGIQLGDLELDKARHLFDLHHDHVDQVGRAQDMGHQHGKDIADRKNAAAGLNPDGTPLVPPGTDPNASGGAEGGAAPAGNPADPAAGGGIVPPANEVGAGGGIDPATIGAHGVPAADAGAQQNADAADQQANLESSLKKPKSRKVRITGRGPDGRASEFQID
jgi:hypothetical protein